MKPLVTNLNQTTMARLVVNPGSPAAWEIQLKPGANSLGRSQANDFQIADGSVSGSHCQIVMENDRAVIRDLGSTNGTFVNRAPIKESPLQTGQTVHLGGVAMMFYSDAPPAAAAAAPRVAGLPPPRIAGAAPAVRIVGAAPVAQVAADQTELAEAPPVTGPALVTSSQPCKFHPKSAGRWFCSKCKRYFCDFCVTTRTVGEAQMKMCRQCGVEVAPVQVTVAGEKGFFVRLPGVFVYPFKGAGPFVLIVSMIVMAVFSFLGAFAFYATVLYCGYMFAFMQTILHSTASEDEVLPGWPAWDDIGEGVPRLFGSMLFSFGPAIGLFCYTMWKGGEASEVGGAPMLAALIFGCFYFPMALLAVAMKDSPLAGNPLVVLPAIVKVPLEYIVTVIMMAAVLAVYQGGEMTFAAMFPKGMLTHSMVKLFEMFGVRLVWNFLALYLLAVNMRILGLLYVAKKRRFGWFAR
jgi:hypothetical protein